MAKARREPTIYTREYLSLLKQLKDARISAGLSQTDLAKRMKLHQTAVSKFEIGDRLLDVVRLRQWCRAIGIDFVATIRDWDSRTG